MTIYERWAEIKCTKCGYYGGTKKVDLSEFKTGRMWSRCPECKVYIESKIYGIEKNRKMNK